MVAFLIACFLVAVSGGDALAGEGAEGFPLPGDARLAGTGGVPSRFGGRTWIYVVPRVRPAVTVDVRRLLDEHGWKIVAEAGSPGRSIRLTVSKGRTAIVAYVAGEGKNTAIILRLP